MPSSAPTASPGDPSRAQSIGRESVVSGSLARIGVQSSRTMPGAAHAAVVLSPNAPGVEAPRSSATPMPNTQPQRATPEDASDHDVESAAPEIDPPRISHTSVGDPAFWPRMLELCTGNRRLRVVLDAARLIEAKPDPCGVTIEVSGQMIQAARSYARDIEGLAATIAGESVSLVLRSPDAESRLAADAPAAPRTPVQEHPLVKQAMELFKARLLSVQQRQPPQSQ